MRLIDQILQAPEAVRVRNVDGTHVTLPGVDEIAPLLRRCALRYVLTNPVTEMAAQVAFEPDSVLGDCLDIMHAPAPAVWMEFDHVPRAGVLRELGMAPSSDPRPQRVGLYVRASGEALRCGEIRIIWESTDGMAPAVSPICVDFNFDNPGFSYNVDLAALRWRPAIPQLDDLMCRMRTRMQPAWQAYYAKQCGGPAHLNAVVRQNLLLALGDAPMLFALFLLTMSGRALRERSVDLSGLNNARARKGKPALAEHVELHMNIGDRQVRWQGDDGGAIRQSPRLHLVRGHLVRRADRVFWRSPHLRGAPERGEIKSRTITLRAERA